MTILQDDYNTQRPILGISEYGRHVQEYIEHIKSLPSKEERTSWVHNLAGIMATLNPDIKLQVNYKEILWGHIFQMADYDLDVDCPYEIVQVKQEFKRPEHLGYNASGIRFRFYGRNLQMMIDKAGEMEDGELKQDLVNMIASFMYNSCKAWNNENLSNEVIAEHLKTLSKGQLKIEGSELVVSADTTLNVRQPLPQKTNNFGRNNNNKNKNNKNRGKNFRRF
ncbi:MAG: DUF4290 domain-containing protein [Flavobacteriaceae bacterium]|nr:DUF4290 domain-containing protein [Flavobacteriaceae bacterium]PHX76917.1 MAG: hypothetical protein CK543_04725 [Flavobacteriales bacterium]